MASQVTFDEWFATECKGLSFEARRAQVQGKTFRVMDVQPITKSGADVIYICQLRV